MNKPTDQPINYEFPKELNSFKDRELKWLWHYMSRTGFTLPLEYTLQPSQRRQTMANMLALAANYGACINDVLNKKSDMLIPFDNFEWIDKRDPRQVLWVFMQCNVPNSGLQIRPFDNTPAAERFNEIVYAFDRWNVRHDEKVSHLLYLKALWPKARTPSQQTKWLDPKDEDQMTWALNYLFKNNRAHTSLIPSNNKEVYTYILYSLDIFSYSHISEKQLFIEKMKKTWSQKKYRSSAGAKKQNYLPMTKTTRDRLDRIVEHECIKISDVLEAIINEKYTSIYGDK